MNADEKRVKDPVCGMWLEPATAAGKWEYAGETYYFYNPRCLATFKVSPEDYLGEREQAAAAEACPACAPIQSARYVCPMCEVVEAEAPGPCPKCGMALEPALPEVVMGQVEYTCPMHPEIVQPEPGSCPKCGMALEPRTVSAESEENPELHEMTWRFWLSLALAVPLMVLTFAAHNWPAVESYFGNRLLQVVQFALATPVMWAGWPLFQRGLGEKPCAEYVYPDCLGHRRGIRLQRGGPGGTWYLSGLFPRGLGHGGGAHHCLSFCPGASNA